MLQHAEDVELVRVARAVRGGEGQRIQPFRKVAPVVVQHGLQNRIGMRFPREPSARLHDVVRKDGVIHAVAVTERVVPFQLLVAPRIVQQRRRLAHLRRLGVEPLALCDRLCVAHDERGVNALELHHRRKFSVHLEAVHILVVQPMQSLNIHLAL